MPQKPHQNIYTRYIKYRISHFIPNLIGYLKIVAWGTSLLFAL